MGGRVQIMQHAFSVFWTLLFFVCSTWDSGNASVNVEGTGHGYGRDSIRLLRLKLLALELGSDVRSKKVLGTPHFFSETDTENPEPSWRLLKSLTSGRATSQDLTQKRDDDLLLDRSDVITTPDRRELQITLLRRLYRDVTGMDNVHQQYGNFYGFLTDFVNLLATRFKTGSPAALQYVTGIPRVLPKDDPDFANGNVDKIVIKCTFVLEMTKEVINRASTFVKPDYAQWFSSTSSTLFFYSEMVNWSLMSLRLSDDGSSSGISILPDGISGINTGVQNGIDYQTLKNLSELVKVLEAAPYVQQTS